MWEIYHLKNKNLHFFYIFFEWLSPGGSHKQ